MVQKVQASIVSITRLNDTIWRYVLKPTQFIPYQAGQYLQIHRPEGEHFFSIANAPTDEQHYELHVRHRALSQLWLIQQELSLSLPYGICDVSQLHLQKPILFLAVGTGFAPIRAMIEQLLAQSDPRHFELHWRVAVAADLYDPESLQHYREARPTCEYFPHVCPANQFDWIPSIIENHPDLKDWQIVMAGPFDLMFAMQKELLAYGLSRDVIFSDAFEFAK